MRKFIYGYTISKSINAVMDRRVKRSNYQLCIKADPNYSDIELQSKIIKILLNMKDCPIKGRAGSAYLDVDCQTRYTLSFSLDRIRKHKSVYAFRTKIMEIYLFNQKNEKNITYLVAWFKSMFGGKWINRGDVSYFEVAGWFNGNAKPWKKYNFPDELGQKL